jgi:serine/threonine-protein kinase RsbW
MTPSTPPPTPSDPYAEIERVRVAIDLEIPSDVRYIERIVAVVTRQCADLDYSSRHLHLNVPVALSEALSNAILRGNNERTDRAVRVRSVADREALVLEVGDQGDGFDLDACTNEADDPDFLEREDGRGLFLMRKLMTRVERFDDHGNVVRLTLRRA